MIWEALGALGGHCGFQTVRGRPTTFDGALIHMCVHSRTMESRKHTRQVNIVTKVTRKILTMFIGNETGSNGIHIVTNRLNGFNFCEQF